MGHKNIKQALNISSLILKYLRKELTDAERRELSNWLNASPHNRNLLRKVFDEKVRTQDLNMAGEFDAEEGFNKLLNKIHHSDAAKSPKIITLKPYHIRIAAACLLVALTIGGLMLGGVIKISKTSQPLTAKISRPKPSNIELTLADGRKINLEKQGTGVITQQGASVVTKKDSALLTYQTRQQPVNADESLSMNTLSIPRGKLYQLILPDGSKVWLNAQTKLQFPSNFKNDERVVELTGEAYFEVAHFSNWPFRVKSAGQTVEVLGTKFNITGYPEDGQTTTTLASGSVKVYNDNATQMLKPGQMALLTKGNSGFALSTADVDETLAWKDGILVFKDANTDDLMRAIGRAFDVDFEIDDKVKAQHFGGSYPIKNGLANLLRNLEQTNVVHFKINGRRVNVMP